MKFTLKLKEMKADNLHLYRQWFCTTVSGLTSFACGLTFGITAVILPQLRADKSIQYDESYDSWIASSAVLAMIVGSIISGSILDYYGRKSAHIILGIPSIIGWIFIACANSTTLLVIGRLFTGISTGTNKSVTLVYVGEITDPKLRSVALFLPGVMTHGGVIFSHVIGHYLSWRIGAIVCVVPTLLSCIIFVFLKESPLWLIVKGRIEEGIETFRWFRGTGEASECELKTILQRQSKKPNINIKETIKTMSSISFIKPMAVMIVVMVSVQFSGVNVISFYFQDFFENAFSKNIDAFLLIMLTDSIRATAAIIIFILGKLVPKKIAFLVCTFVVAVFSFALVACFLVNFENVPILVLFWVIYILFSSAIVALGWSFTPELLPSNIRGVGSGLSSAFSFLLLFIITKITPDFMSMYGGAGLFGFFGISTLVCGVILTFTLPETHGKSLQSIEDSYSKNKNEQTQL